jgi:hypothetical protein
LRWVLFRHQGRRVARATCLSFPSQPCGKLGFTKASAAFRRRVLPGAIPCSLCRALPAIENPGCTSHRRFNWLIPRQFRINTGDSQVHLITVWDAALTYPFKDFAKIFGKKPPSTSLLL